MTIQRKEADITENVAGGNVEHIISILERYLEIGFDRLYWDGYDSTIVLYKSCDCEEKKDEKSISSYHLPPHVEAWIIKNRHNLDDIFKI